MNMAQSKTRTLITATFGLLLGSLGATLVSTPARACSCATLVDVYELSLVSAESDDADEVARWPENAELYSSFDGAFLSLEDDFLNLDRVEP